MLLDPVRKRSTTGSALTADILALRTLEILVADTEQMRTFLDETGLDGSELRGLLRDGSMQGGLLDHAMRDDKFLIVLAESLDCSPEDTAAAILRVRARPSR